MLQNDILQPPNYLLESKFPNSYRFFFAEEKTVLKRIGNIIVFYFALRYTSVQVSVHRNGIRIHGETCRQHVISPTNYTIR